MGKYTRTREKTGYGVPEGRTLPDEIDSLIELSFDPDPMVRSAAAKHLCPCHVRADVPKVWDRIIQLVTDPEAVVRRDAVHALADGSPRERAHEIAAILEPMYNDPDAKVRRMVRKVVNAYRQTGSVNVL